ncbi:PTH2-domain-containing protein [Ephemerocybe angulata]|uniref:peptidyl-tRNA hydrolase n=1 Tax=Ephemerocybe angulata TaxID=980116 RepID=A0A8H6ME98_9AGAR|nr:PTH2-domain-containing protein [Tulosesus angulatus]
MEGSNVSTYSAIVAVSVALGFWLGKICSKRSGRPRGLRALKVDKSDECKLALVVRMDLGMKPGKIAAQCSHATLACYKDLVTSNSRLLRHWERTGQTKVVLRCASEEELLTLQVEAQNLHLCARSIRDAGRTQIAAGSRTVLGVLGPAKLVNQVTGKLKLL